MLEALVLAAHRDKWSHMSERIRHNLPFLEWAKREKIDISAFEQKIDNLEEELEHQLLGGHLTEFTSELAFVPVWPMFTVDDLLEMIRIEPGGQTGLKKIDVRRIKDRYPRQRSEPYWIYGVTLGQAQRNKKMALAISSLAAGGQRPLTLHEGLSVALFDPEAVASVLAPIGGFYPQIDLAGSVHDTGVVPSLKLYSDDPEVEDEDLDFIDKVHRLELTFNWPNLRNELIGLAGCAR